MKNNYTIEDIQEAFEQSRLTNPIVGFKYDTWNDYAKNKGILPQLEVCKWYKGSDKYPKLLSCVTSVEERTYYYYGFNVCGEWVENDHYDYIDDVVLSEATDEEVLEALTKEAEKRGHGYLYYKYIDDTLIGYYKDYSGDVLFYDGEWTTIIDELNQELEALKKKYQELGKEIENLESK